MNKIACILFLYFLFPFLALLPNILFNLSFYLLLRFVLYPVHHTCNLIVMNFDTFTTSSSSFKLIWFICRFMKSIRYKQPLYCAYFFIFYQDPHRSPWLAARTITNTCISKNENQQLSPLDRGFFFSIVREFSFK